MHERRFAGTADTGDARQRVHRDFHVDVLEVVLARAKEPELLTDATTPRRRHRNRQLVAEILGGQRPRLLQQSRQIARKDHTPALFAGTESHVDDVIGNANHVFVVLDDEHGVALVAQLPKDVDQPLVVARMQADRRLVEHVQRTDERRPERRGEVDPLGFAARERGRQPVERQVVETDVHQERQTAANLAQHLFRDSAFFLREFQSGEELLRFT